MMLAAQMTAGFVMAFHLMIVVVEMFLWTHPIGMKMFRLTPEKAADSKVLAANQGLYNGFLAAGLAWGLWSSSREFLLFFLGCVVVAGVYGAASTGNTRILIAQGAPAALGLGLVWFAFV